MLSVIGKLENFGGDRIQPRPSCDDQIGQGNQDERHGQHNLQVGPVEPAPVQIHRAGNGQGVEQEIDRKGRF